VSEALVMERIYKAGLIEARAPARAADRREGHRNG
jgi:hypothetical protein